MLATLASGNEDDIPLAGVGVVVLEEEKVIDSVIPQRGGLHYQAHRAG